MECYGVKVFIAGGFGEILRICLGDGLIKLKYARG